MKRNSTSQKDTGAAVKCEVCQDRGYIAFDRDGYFTTKDCNCTIAKRHMKMLERAEIAEAFEECTFDTFEPCSDVVKVAKKCALEYANTFQPNPESKSGHSLMLLGEVGSGKTTLGICVMRTILNNGIAALYTPYRDMMHTLKSAVKDEEKYEIALDKYFKPKVLFLDDLYKGMTEADVRTLYDLVNARYLAKKPVIVTSELTVESMRDIDDAIATRLVEMSRGYIYELRGNGLNYRLRGL